MKQALRFVFVIMYAFVISMLLTFGLSFIGLPTDIEYMLVLVISFFSGFFLVIIFSDWIHHG